MNTKASPIHNCWNASGVWGSRSCPELQQHVHCRHCPVYVQVAARMLDREISVEHYENWEDEAIWDRNQAETQTASLVVVRLGDEWLALPTGACSEITESGPIHSLPHRSDLVVLGIVNIRGELLILVNLARILGIDVPGGVGDYRRFIVYGSGSQRLVFPVNEVQGISRFDCAEIAPVPATLAKARSSFTTGVLVRGSQTIAVLEGESLAEAINRRLS